MSLKNLKQWNLKEEVEPAAACGAGDQPQETPTACGASDEPSTACGSACGAADQE